MCFYKLNENTLYAICLLIKRLISIYIHIAFFISSVVRKRRDSGSYRMKESRYGHKKGSLKEKTRWQEIKEAAGDTATGTHALICLLSCRLAPL